MQVCKHNGLVIVVQTRDEHCPPHVPVGPSEGDARFKFSFWHNSVCSCDVKPVQNKPAAKVLEGLRQALMQPVHLRRAREIWWNIMQTMCLENLQWDPQQKEVIAPKTRRTGTVKIQSARFEADARMYRTILNLEGPLGSWEINYE